MQISRLILIGSTAVLAACTDPGDVVNIQRDGTVAGLAFIDVDADGLLTTVDAPAAGVSAALVAQTTSDTVARATTRQDGTFTMANVPVGSYRLLVSRGVLGDSIEVQRLDSTAIQLAAGDTATRVIQLGFPTVSVSAARVAPTGRRVVVEGLALNAWSSFQDSTIHILDATGALRSIRVQATAVQAGDSVRALGRLGVEQGRAVLVDVTARVLAGARSLPAPDSLATARAASADAGRLADGQARIAGAIVLDTLTVGNYRRLRVDDGSGQLEILLNRSIPFAAQAHTPGALISASGLLVQSGSQWQLKPRRPDDVTASFPTASAAGARTLPAGTRVNVMGIALNGWSTFGDSTLHVADASGAIRAVRVLPSAVAAGDSVRVLGTTGLSSGRVALVDASVTIAALARGLPNADSMSTGAAATASNGSADGQVRIAGAIIRDTATVAGDVILGVDDGTGRLEVVLDRHVAFNPGPWLPGGTLAASGVLTPAPSGGGWRLKPRDRNEAVLSFPTVTTAEARTMELGRRVVLEGVALNSWSTFGDSSVHLLDRTGVLRAVRVQNPVAAGDSVRLMGPIATRAGQPILGSAVATVLRVAVGVPEPDSITTAVARSADGGTLDAAQVRVGGTIVGFQAQTNGDVVFSINDGSGLLEVVFDADVAFATGPYVPGALLRAAGVLVPTGSGTWQLKPRAAQDASATYPSVTIAAARSLPAGKNVYIEGTALNGWVTFGDSTVHVRDGTGTIRTMAIPSTALFAGDSVRILGTVTVRNGQPVIMGIAANVILAGGAPPVPDSVTTAVAANAQGGSRDAGQVAISGVITAIDSTSADWTVTVDDGSGPLRIVLDRDIGFGTGALRAGARLRARGLLVPLPSGIEWVLKPRALNEVVVTT